uniref:Protein TsetseEP domain-containing protein n=1 Tax=Anopheles epiroticus TaxID=199890 RepID=A0A182PPN9_9DIPT
MMSRHSLLCCALLLALFAINLQHVSGQFDNAVVSKRRSINSTLASFANNIVNKVNDYSNKFTSLRNDMSSQLRGASDTVTRFLSEQSIEQNALATVKVVQSSTAALEASVSASLTGVATFNTVGTCVDTKTQASVVATFDEFRKAQAEFFTIIGSSSSSFLSTCRSRFTNTAQDLVNQAGDRFQDCINDENNELGRVSWIINNFVTLIKQNYQGLGQHVRFCTGLGSPTSRDEVKAEINACFKGISIYVAPIYEATIAQQFTLMNTMVQMEIVASNNRVKSCINQISKTYTAMAQEIVPALNQCLTSALIPHIIRNNPNIQSAANMVSIVTSDLQGAISGFQVAKQNGSTSLIVSGEALVSLVTNITVNVNDVLRNISFVSSNRQTAPSCMFGSMNATIDRAFVALDQASTLIQSIQTSAAAQSGGTLTSWVMMIQTAMLEISTNLDLIYEGVVKVLATTGTLTSATISANIPNSLLVNVAGAISVVTTAEKGLSTTVRAIRSSFEQAGNILNSYSNDLNNAMTSVNNTQRDYYNQVVSRITSYQNKINWEFGWGVTDIRNTLSRLNNFISDMGTRDAARALEASIGATMTSIQTNATFITTNLQSQMTLLFTGAEAFVQSNVKALMPVFDSAVFNLSATMSTGGAFASNCNSKYGGAITNIENNMRDALQKCFNEYANTGYTDSFISEYNMVIREQTRSIANRINFCLNLGSTSSNRVIKAGISACLAETVALSDALMQDVSIQSKVVVAMINLESLAMVQRVESCAAIANHGLVAKAAKLEELLTICQTTNHFLDLLSGSAAGLAAGTTGPLSLSGSLTGGLTLGGVTVGGTGTINSNLPILNLVNNVVTSTLTALNTAVNNIGTAAGTLLTNTLSTITNTLNGLLGGVTTNLNNIGSGLSGAATAANGQIVINGLNSVATAVNSAVNAASAVFGNSTVSDALGNLTSTMNADLATAIQAINNATANPGTATTLLGALGPNGINTIATFLGDAANVLYTTANIPLQLTAAAQVNATLAANAGVPYTAAGIAAVNATVNTALTNANNVLNAAVGSFSTLIANVLPETNAALAQGINNIRSSLTTLNNVFNLLAGSTKTSVTAAANTVISNLTDLVNTLQTGLGVLNTVTLNAVVSANASIAGNASAVIGPIVENLGSTNATIVNCSQTYLPLAVRTNVFYTTALGGCVVEATTVADILVGNTIAVVNSAVSRVRGSTAGVTVCISSLFPSTLCRTATVPNAPAYITNVALDVANIKTGEVVDIANTANEVATCTDGTANAAAADFAAIADAYNACIGA